MYANLRQLYTIKRLLHAVKKMLQRVPKNFGILKLNFIKKLNIKVKNLSIDKY